MVGLSLASIRSDTAQLNASIRTTRAVVVLKADLVKSIGNVDRKVADTNQKPLDLVELDDLTAEQKKTHARSAEVAGDAKQRSTARAIGSAEGVGSARGVLGKGRAAAGRLDRAPAAPRLYSIGPNLRLGPML